MNNVITQNLIYTIFPKIKIRTGSEIHERIRRIKEVVKGDGIITIQKAKSVSIKLKERFKETLHSHAKVLATLVAFVLFC